MQCDMLLENDRKKFKADLDDTFTLRCVFIRSNFARDVDLPKSVLQRYSQKCRLKPPKYETINLNKLFQSTVIFDGKRYSSCYW